MSGKSPKYLKQEDVPTEFREYFNFSEQKTLGANHQLHIKRRCRRCGVEDWGYVSTIRRSIAKGEYTGCCQKCVSPMTAKIGAAHHCWRGGVTLSRATLRRCKLSAVERGYSWELSDQDAFELMAKDCHYCGSAPSNMCRNPSYKGRTNKTFVYNGIDRVDNTKGYTKSNCVTACWKCNCAKRKMTHDEFINHATKIACHSSAVLPSPYVFEAYQTGDINIAALEGKLGTKEIVSESGEKRQVPIAHGPARRFRNRIASDLDPEAYGQFWKANGHLPAMPSEAEWVSAGKFSLGDLIQRLIETCEVQAVHIDKLHERIQALE